MLSRALGPLEGGGAPTTLVQSSLAFPLLPCLPPSPPPPVPQITRPLRGKEACYRGVWPLENRGPSEDTRSHWLTADYSKVEKGARTAAARLLYRDIPHARARARAWAWVAGRPAGVCNPVSGALPAAGRPAQGLGPGLRGIARPGEVVTRERGAVLPPPTLGEPVAGAPSLPHCRAPYTVTVLGLVRALQRRASECFVLPGVPEKPGLWAFSQTNGARRARSGV